MTREEAVKVMQLNIAECEDTLCYSENKGIREQKEAFEIALEALQPWVRTEEVWPEDEDIVIAYNSYLNEMYSTVGLNVSMEPETFPYWMPIPPLPKGEKA